MEKDRNRNRRTLSISTTKNEN